MCLNPQPAYGSLSSYGAALLCTWRKTFLKKISFQVEARPVKRTETRQGWENSRTLPYYGMMVPSFPGLQCNALSSLVHFIHKEVKYRCTQVHCIGGQRAERHHSLVGLCSWVFSSQPCYCLFTGPDLTWNELFSETFSLIFVLFGDFLTNF